jgi:hypothetical protein
MSLDFTLTDHGAASAPPPGGSQTFDMPALAFLPATMSPTDGPRGTVFVAQAGGFGRGAALAAALDGAPLALPLQANGDGEWTLTLDSTALSGGLHALRFKCDRLLDAKHLDQLLLGLALDCGNHFDICLQPGAVELLFEQRIKLKDTG